MAKGTYSDAETPVDLQTVEDLDRFLDGCEARSAVPVAVSVHAHGHRADILVGHARSLVHLAPDEAGSPYFITVGESTPGLIDVWLHGQHHTQFEVRHLVAKEPAREAMREFFEAGTRSSAVRWERYDA